MDSGWHTHTAAYQGVVIQGKFTVDSTEKLQVPSDAALLYGLHGARE
jgi:hypothetical protein